MEKLEKSIEVMVPVKTAYNQWTQFEDFPKFMEGVKSVHQQDETHLHWVVEVAGKEKEWDAEIVEQTPDKRIAWKNQAGTQMSGVITFHYIEPNKTKIMVQMDYEPKGLMENIADAIGLVSGRVQGDLKRFKEFIEKRGTETGAWRGEVENPSEKMA